ncbi:MAG: MarR family transcriptional regulator [Cyanobacteria bacterium SZAS TMP-1]|nr:MarR family transcriptional regulator [Cyanobacteria bacterium SZAS TMP-1]
MTKKSDLPDIETASFLAAQLRSVFRRLKRQLREHGGPRDLTPSQISVLLRLEAYGPDTVSSLARAEGVRPQSMSSTIAALQEADLVTGMPDSSDGRKTLMVLSKNCEKLLREVRAARHDWLTRAIMQKLSAQEQQQLGQTLELLNRLADDGSLD